MSGLESTGSKAWEAELGFFLCFFLEIWVFFLFFLPSFSIKIWRHTPCTQVVGCVRIWTLTVMMCARSRGDGWTMAVRNDKI